MSTDNMPLNAEGSAAYIAVTATDVYRQYAT